MKLEHVFWLCLGMMMLVGISRYTDQSKVAPEPNIANVTNIPKSTQQPAPQTTSYPTSVKPYWDGNGVILKREVDGHFYANATIQGRNIRFLVDTGATAVALTSKDAEALGLFWTPAELTTVGRGVSGDVMGKTVIIPRIQVGNLQAENIPAAIIPEGLDVSLLGQAFLSQVGNVNISDDKMTLQ